MWIALKHFMGWKHLWHRHSEECNSFFWTLTIRGLLPFLTPLLRTENYGLFCWSVVLQQTRTPINILFDCRDNLSMNRMKHARCLCRLLNSIDWIHQWIIQIWWYKLRLQHIMLLDISVHVGPTKYMYLTMSLMNPFI